MCLHPEEIPPIPDETVRVANISELTTVAAFVVGEVRSQNGVAR